MTPDDAPRLNVRYDEGRGPVIVLLHGINSDASAWRAVINHIGPGYRCIALDLLGFGDSPKPPDAEYTADEHVAAVAATLATLAIAEKFVLVGYSLGGDIALRYAATYPDEVRRLFMLSTPYYLPPDALERRRTGLALLSETVFNQVWKLAGRRKKRRGVIYDIGSGRLEDFARAFIREGDGPGDWDVVSKNLKNTIAEATLVDDLPRLTMPAVFALGVRDAVVRPDQSSALKQLKPDLRIRHILAPQADHCILGNMPQRVAEEIMADEVRELAVPFRDGLGEPTVLLHDVAHGARRWEPVAKALAMRGEVATIDLLGFGESPAPLLTHYSLEDHVAAVLNTLDVQFPGRRVRLVGTGFGGLVALACAAARPTAVSQVVAFSAALLPPGVNGQYVSHPAVAAIAAQRQGLLDAIADLGVLQSAETVERRVVAALRSLDAVLEVDSARLVERIRMPARLIESAPDQPVPREWLRELVASNPNLELIEADSAGDIAFDKPAEALTLIGGVTEAQIYSAASAVPVPEDARPKTAAALGNITALLLRRGTLMLLGGMAPLVAFRASSVVVAIGAPVWLLIEALVLALGCVGLKRSGRSWRPWVLLAVTSALFSALLVVGILLTFEVIAPAFGVWAVVRGLAAASTAIRVRETTMVRWALGTEGLLSIVAAALLLLVTPLGAVLPYTLAGYLIASGANALVFYALVQRDVRRRLDLLLPSQAE